MIKTDTYATKMKKGEITFPDSPAAVNYPLLALQYMYAAWASNAMRTRFSDSGVVCSVSGRTFAELRAYGRGVQSSTKYMDILDPEDPDGNRSEGLMNISWDNAKFFSKFRDIMYGMIGQAQFDPTVEAIDKASDREKRKIIGRMKLSRTPQMKQIQEMTGIKSNEPREFMLLDSEEDIDLLYSMGGVRLASEILLKDSMDTIFKDDLPNVAEKWRDDLIDLSLCAGVIEYDETLGRPKLCFVDPGMALIEHSVDGDHTDDQVFGYMTRVPIISLSDYFNDEEMEKLYDHAYSTRPKTSEIVRKDFNAAKETKFDNLHIWVLKGWWIDDESQKFVTGMRKNGVYIHDQVELGSELSSRDRRRGKDFETYNTQYVYKGCWIIGTDLTYMTGKDNLIVRKGPAGKKKAILPSVIFDGNTESMVSRCISDIDDIQLAILKRRLEVANMIPGPGMVIDKSKLNDDIQIGKQTYSILDMMQIFPRTGVFVYSSRGEFDEMNGSQKPPIDFVQTKAGENIVILINEVRDKLDAIRQQIGINEVTDGTSQTQDMLNGVMQGMMAASNNALSRVAGGYYSLHSRTATLLGMKLQTAIYTGQMPIEELEGSGIWGKEILKKSLFDGSFRFGVSTRPTQQMRQLLLADLTQYKNNSMITPEVYYLVVKLIDDGDLQKAQLFMSKAVQRKTKQDYEMEMQRVKQTAEANGQTAVMSEQAKQQTIQLQAQLKLAEMAEDLKHSLAKIQEEGRVRGENLDKEIAIREMRYSQRD